jgi:hypothetical protein
MGQPTGGTAALPTRKPTDDELDVYGHFLISSLRKQALGATSACSAATASPATCPTTGSATGFTP